MRGNRSSCEVTGSSYPTAKRPRRPAGFGENRAQAASATTPAKADRHDRLRDGRYAVRVLMKAKASTAAAILILALGIGGNIAMFTFLDRLLYAPLPVPKPSQLQLVSCSGFARFPDGDRFKMGCRYDAYVYLRDRNQAFSGLAATMVAGPAVFIRSFRNLRSVPVGFSPEHVSAITLASANDDPETIKAPFREAALLAESLRGAPGVESATVADLLTFSDSRISFSLTVPGDPAQPKRTPNLLRVDGSYFDALRIPLIACRAFSAHDDRHAPKVAILSDGTARRLFGGQSPLGRRILNRTS